MAVELEGARRDTDTSTVEDHDLAYSRWKVFAGMYYDLHAQPAGSNYQATVSAALGRGIKELDRVWIPEGSKPELVALNQEIGLFLGIESDLHFKDLA
jgi:hypothetical protein